jgi:hypothetical protein
MSRPPISAQTATARLRPTAISRPRRSARAGEAAAAETGARSRRAPQLKRSQIPPAASFDPDLFPWAPWHPREAQRVLAGVEAPWYVAAGWGLDLFLGGQHREHEDLEIAVPNSRFDEIVEALAGLEVFIITGPHEATPLEDARDQLEETHQSWVLERDAGAWRLDVFREPSAGDTWISRRHEDLRMPYDRAIERTGDGIPYGRPEIILLYKAKHARDKDEGDFEAALPHLDSERRRWLADALGLVHPGHRWLDALG